MTTIQFMNIRLEGKPIGLTQLIRKFNYPGLYKRMYSNRFDRKLYYKDMRITWELYNLEKYWTANGVRYDNKIHMSAALKVNHHSVRNRKGDEWYFKGIHFVKHENLTLCTDQMPPKNSLPVQRKSYNTHLIPVEPQYDLYNLNGIQLVRKFLKGNLINTYAYDRGAEFLNL